MIAQLAKETAIAVVLFFLASLLIDLSGGTMAERITGAVVFGVIYAALGLVIKLIRKRSK